MRGPSGACHPHGHRRPAHQVDEDLAGAPQGRSLVALGIQGPGQRRELLRLRTKLGVQLLHLRTKLGVQLLCLRTKLGVQLLCLRTKLGAQLLCLRVDLCTEFCAQLLPLLRQVAAQLAAAMHACAGVGAHAPQPVSCRALAAFAPFNHPHARMRRAQQRMGTRGLQAPQRCTNKPMP
jgi:hypothetical protein